MNPAEAIRNARELRIVLLTGLGDVVHGLPIANAIRRAYPNLRITWVAEPMPAGILAGHPAIDRVVVFRKKDGFAGVRRLRHDLAGDSPDISLNLNVYFKSVFPAMVNSAAVRLGFDRARSRDGVWLFNTHSLPARPRAHTQDMFIEFLELLGIDPEPIEWKLEPTDEERAAQTAFFAEHVSHAEQVVAVVTASANPKKDWPADRYVPLVERLYHEQGLRPLLIGGPGTTETVVARTIVEKADAPVINGLGDGVRRLIWQLERCRLLIAPDTGPVHIARAMGIPVVGLYGHTNPWRVGPWRAFHDLWIDVYTEPGQSPDASNFTPKLGRMDQITVDQVVEKAARALEHYRPPQRGESS